MDGQKERKTGENDRSRRILKNLKFQETHFKEIFDSYDFAEKPKQTDRKRKPYLQKKYLHLLCEKDMFKSVAEEVFGCVFPELRPTPDSVIITQGYEENTEYDSDLRRLTIETLPVYPLRHITVFMSDQMTEPYLELSFSVLYNKESLVSGRKNPGKYDFRYFESCGDLKKMLEAYEFSYHTAFPECGEEREEKTETGRGEPFYCVCAAPVAILKMAEAEINFQEKKDLMREIEEDMYRAFMDNAKALLADALRKGEFIENFQRVERYRKAEETVKEEFRSFIKRQLFQEYRNVCRSRNKKLRGEFLTALSEMESMRMMDGVISEKLGELKRRMGGITSLQIKGVSGNNTKNEG